jgi:peroxiredoxin
MFNFDRSWAAVITVSLALAGGACRPRTPEKSAEKGKKIAAAADKEVKDIAAREAKLQQEPPPRPTIPKVVLSDAFRAACVVTVNDDMPDAELRDPAGNLHTLSSLCGPDLAVVCFWTIGNTSRSRLIATQTLKDLMKNVAEPFGEKGVRVIGINVGDTVQDAQQHIAQAGATFPNLLDPKGDYFAELARDRQMPRTYLLDGSGKILWFDVEYSRSSRQDLVQGIRVALGEL